MRTLLLLLAMFMPMPLKREWYRRMLGWRVGKRVRIGLSYIDAQEVELGDDVHIGHFNFAWRVSRLSIGARTYMSNFNMFSGSFESRKPWTRTVTIGAGCYVMSHHFFDVAGDLVIGPHTSLAGRDSQFWTHTRRVVDGEIRLLPLPLRIGLGCYVGARSTLLFCDVPDNTIIGAASVVTGRFEPPTAGTLLLAGNPAVVRKVYPPKSPVDMNDCDREAPAGAEAPAKNEKNSLAGHCGHDAGGSHPVDVKARVVSELGGQGQAIDPRL